MSREDAPITAEALSARGLDNRSEASDQRRASAPSFASRLHGASALRVLHAPTDVGGNASGLVAAERALGLRSTLAVFARSSFRYPVDVDLDLGGRSRLGRLAARVRFFAASIPRYDVFHFNFGQSLLPTIASFGVDLPLLRALGKRVFTTFQGCDARLVSFLRAHYADSCCGHHDEPGLCRVSEDRRRRRAIAYATRHAHRVLCLNPDLLHVVPGAEFMPYASIDPALVRPDPDGERMPKDRPLTIVHAPTNQAVKGSRFVLAAREALAHHRDVRWLFVQHMTHEQAMQAYRQADLAIDQLRVGWYGAFAVEMMAMGKPVICYVRDEDLRIIPRSMAAELPIIRATPGTLIDVLAHLLTARDQLGQIGERSRRYVERWHDPVRIAGRLLALYQNPSLPFWDDATAAGR